MASAATTTRRFTRPSEIPPLRRHPFEPDELDEARCAFNKALWHSQDELLRQRDRQVEENLRMLHGQHWIAWSDLRQRFVDIASTLSDDEKRWRHFPVLNRLFLWFVLLHARMNENPPVLSWQAGPDRIDALLAETADVLFKHLWYDVEMLEVLDRLTAWMIPSGRAYLKSRIDPMKGDPILARGPAVLQLVGPDGEPIERYVDDVPWGPDEAGEWRPRAALVQDGDDYAVRPTGFPHVIYEGGLEVDVLTCLEVRGEWGEHTPWHRKAWHTHRSLLTPLQAYEMFGMELEPDVRGEDAESVGILWRLLHGSGLFGAADSRVEGYSREPGTEFVTIYETWFRPSRLPGMQRTPESPGGRLLITTGGGVVIRDGVRPAAFRYTSPIRCFDMVSLPGRPQGTSPQEFLNGPIRTRNRLHAQAINVAAKMANPLRIVDRSAGIQAGDIKGIPGEEILADRSRSRGPVVEFVAPPAIGSDVYQVSDRLATEVDQIGNISGTEGTPPTRDPSGELVKELRFNADRPIAATMRRMVIELGRMAEDWIALLPLIYDREKVISIVGEDGIDRTITVYPMLFEQGKVNVKPEIESMLPESRAERQQRAYMLWKDGAYGDPTSPEAINKFLEEARFPHMSRLVRPGGVDRSTAAQNVGRLLQGASALEIPILPWYDLRVHIDVLERFLKSPEFLRADRSVQEQCALYWSLLREALIERQLMDEAQALAAQARAARQQAATPSEAMAASEAAPPAGFEAPPEATPAAIAIPAASVTP